MSLTYNELKPGTVFMYEGQPYEVLSFEFLRMQQRKPVAQTKIKNLVTGKILDRNFHQNETFEEVEIEKHQIKYMYHSRGEYWFSEPKDPSKRFSMKEEVLPPAVKFLKANTEVTASKMGNEIISVQVPVKVELMVKEAPPGAKGDTVTGGDKKVVLETGAEITVPLFVNTGDIVRINTSTGQYTERVEKSK